jgi:cell wall-associated NlpC family hydrolase
VKTSNVRVVGVVDGVQVAASTVTNLRNAAITSKYATGATPGFSMDVPVTGRHTVCIIAKNTSHGLDRILHCAGTPLGHGLPGSHSPVGGVMNYWANPTSVHFLGWATDPDEQSRQSIVVMYVDNQAVATVATDSSTIRNRAGAGPRSAFNILVPTTVGSHVVCIWVVNAGPGSNSSLGCRVVDNRGKAGTASFTTPTVNSKVVTEAKKHIGQPYVWGAIGPKTFDCSGLVMYSYKKFGYTTPRISESQFFAAHAIPSSRVRPGDLVFYFDGTGDVFHVGIYLSPGKTVAAIDEQEGVNYQTIWPGTPHSYGSFTHN